MFFWASNAAIIYGTVESTSRMPDGTLVLAIKTDEDEEKKQKVVHVPAAGVTKYLLN